MSVVLCPLPKMRFYDADGSPLAGGKVYVFELGTTTPVTTYINRQGTVANTHPIILDSEGRCSVWVDTPCTFYVTDAQDLFTQDGGDVDPVTNYVTNDQLDDYYTQDEADARYYTQAEVDALVSGSASVITLHPGDYVDTALETAPDGTLVCDGAAYSRETYDELFAAIGVKYGEGNGTTTFNVPDWRGYFPRCWDNGATVDPDRASRTDRGDGTTGDNNGTKQATATKRPTTAFTTSDPGNHTHTGNSSGTAFATAGGPNSFADSGSHTTSAAGAHTHTITGGGDNESRPPNMYQLRCIVY